MRTRTRTVDPGRWKGALGRLAAATLALALLAAAPPAHASFGVSSFDVQVAANAPVEGDEADLAPSGGAFQQAGGHPYAIVAHVEWNNRPDPNEGPQFHGNPLPEGDLKDGEVDLPAGTVGNPATIPTCTTAQLSGLGVGVNGYASECPSDSQVGLVRVHFGGSGIGDGIAPVFNMAAPTGVAARLGFNVAKTLIFFDAELSPERGYRITVGNHRISQALRVYRADVAFWGTPSSSAHDQERCNAGVPHGEASEPEGTVSLAQCAGEPGTLTGPHAAAVAPVAFLTMPTSCPPPGTGEEWPFRTDSWEEPGVIRTASAFTHLPAFFPDAPGLPQGASGCDRVPFDPDFGAQPTQQSAASSSGYEISLKFPTDGILNPGGIAESELKKAVVTLPEGMTVNPSEAEGLGVCSPAQYEAVSVQSFGCPSTAKIGTVLVRTPVLERPIEGNVYIAEPYRNPFDSLLALYIVLRDPARGVYVKVPGKIEPNPRTGQIVASFDDVPQVPFSDFEFHFREGPRAPLITPRTCGTYATVAELYPWARPGERVTSRSSFQITSGSGGGPCPAGGTPPFDPGFSAGSVNNSAAAFTPFDMRLLRGDGEQDMTRFSATLPPGVLGSLAGVEKCSDAAIAAARAKNGLQERADPSCPAGSEIGSTIAGAGVGSSLTYVPGKVYLGGPYHGDPLSVIAVTPAVAGPFDAGTVVVQEALTLNPRTAEVEVDGSASDPIPHILKGIVLSLRDLRVNVDRPRFILNPTSCAPSVTGATLFGSGANPFNTLDDVPVSLSDRFQAASCQSLGFKPTLRLNLKGGTRRGGYPGLRAIYLPRGRDANLRGLSVTLPRSAFLEQAHIRTICTRVQFAARACPKGARYGYIRAWTPLLDDPLQGPVYLRSSNHNLPDMVFDLHGLVDVEVSVRIDSRHGGIRARLEDAPDAPLSKVVLRMQGGKKGLIVNSRNLCFKPKRNRADSVFTGQNGKRLTIKPVLRAVNCAKHRRHKRHHKRAARVARSSVAG